MKAIQNKVHKFGPVSTFGKGRCTGREEQPLDLEKGCDGGHVLLLAGERHDWEGRAGFQLGRY